MRKTNNTLLIRLLIAYCWAMEVLIPYDILSWVAIDTYLPTYLLQHYLLLLIIKASAWIS